MFFLVMNLTITLRSSTAIHGDKVAQIAQERVNCSFATKLLSVFFILHVLYVSQHFLSNCETKHFSFYCTHSLYSCFEYIEGP